MNNGSKPRDPLGDPRSADSFTVSSGANLRGITIRAVRADDRGGIAKAFRALEPESIYRRFFFPKRELSYEELRRLAECDGARDVILVATVASADQEIIVGLGRYARNRRRAARATPEAADGPIARALSDVVVDPATAVRRGALSMGRPSCRIRPPSSSGPVRTPHSDRTSTVRLPLSGSIRLPCYQSPRCDVVVAGTVEEGSSDEHGSAALHALESDTGPDSLIGCNSIAEPHIANRTLEEVHHEQE